MVLLLKIQLQRQEISLRKIPPHNLRIWLSESSRTNLIILAEKKMHLNRKWSKPKEVFHQLDLKLIFKLIPIKYLQKKVPGQQQMHNCKKKNWDRGSYLSKVKNLLNSVTSKFHILVKMVTKWSRSTSTFLRLDYN